MKKDVWARVGATDLLMLCFSVSVSIVGQMLTPLGEAYSLSYTQSGWLVSMQSIGGLILALLIIFFSGINKERFIVTSGMIMGVVIAAVGLNLPKLLLFAVFALMGYAGSTINSLSNPVISDNVPPGKTDRHLSLLHMSFSIGAVATPLLSQYMYTLIGLNGVFLAFGGFIILSVVYAFLAFHKQAAAKTVKINLSVKQRFLSAIRMFKNRGFTTVFILAILISSAQLCMVYYISSYFTDITGEPGYGAASLSAFFLSMMAARLIYSRIAGKYSKGIVLAVTNAVTFLSWTAMFFVPGTIAKLVFLIIGSFFCSNNFPIVFSSSMDAAPSNKSSATGFVVLGYYAALLTFLPAAGALGDVFGLKISVALSVLPILGAAAMGLVLHSRTKKA